MSLYISIYEQYLAELDADERIVELAPERNLQILRELNEGMEEFVNQQKVKERSSEQELAAIKLV